MSGVGLSMPEFEVRDVLEESIDAMLADPAILDEMLAGRPADERDTFRTALVNREGKVRLGWSTLAEEEDWLVTVLLVGTQKLATVGDRASGGEDTALAARELATAITAEPGIPVTFTTGVPAVGEDAGEVPAKGTLRIGSEYAIYAIAAGVCTLVHRGILESKATAHAIDTEVVFYEVTQQVGWPETVTLRVDLLGSSPPFVMALGRMLQGFLVLAAKRFDDRGYTLQDIVLGDLAGRPHFYPAQLFVRTITLRLFTALSLPEFVPVITDRSVTLTTENSEATIAGHSGII
jgi:hypothetical protein